MPESFTVHLNRDGPQSVAGPQSFKTKDDFSVYLKNHGPPLHVHVRTDRSLAEVAEVVTPNRYVEEEAIRRVQVEVDDIDQPVDGRLEIVTGYGSNTEYVSVTVRDPSAVEPDVTVNEELAQSTPSPEPSGGDTDQLVRNAVLGGALLLVITIAVVLGEPLVLVGGLLALVGAMLAGYLISDGLLQLRDQIARLSNTGSVSRARRYHVKLLCDF